MNLRSLSRQWLSLVIISLMVSVTAPFTTIQRAVATPSTASLVRNEVNTTLLSVTEAATTTHRVFLPSIAAPDAEVKSWPMAGANAQRTSWTSEEVVGSLKPAWYRPFEPYIPAKVQIIASRDTLFISTAKGLYALAADTGAQRWVYPTEMPLGNSPTIYNGVAYVGGFDKLLHAVDIATGQKLWTFAADAGFDTNPLVINGLVLLGNRDGYFYAIYGNESALRGTLAWKYKTGGPIHFSAAYADGLVYFASNDNYAYALNAATGQLVWKSAKLPSAGFHSWWPVVSGDRVIFSASRPYRGFTPPQINRTVLYTLWEPDLAEYGYVNAAVNGVINASPEANYFAANPSMKSFYVLNRATGQESSILPARSLGTHSGNRFPAAVGPDGMVYTVNSFAPEKYGQGVSSWTPGTALIRPINRTSITAPDEPLAFSMGGNTIYYNQCCDRSGGYFSIQSGLGAKYFQSNLDTLIPGYNVRYAGTMEENAVAVFGGWNGVYGVHGDQNPPIPYKGRVYMHRGNAVIAWSSTGGARSLPMAMTVNRSDTLPNADPAELRQHLDAEIQAMINAGHLRPGFGAEGLFSRAGQREVGDNLTDYWSSPADTILTLSSAYPHVSPALQPQLKTYLKQEMASYSPCNYTHIGWRDGASRESFDLPPEVQSDIPNYGPSMYSSMSFAGWTGSDWKWQPHAFYALWQYAVNLQLTQTEVRTLFSATCRSRLTQPPDDATLARLPHAHNAWIAGYRGYMELEKLAGEITTITNSSKYATYSRLLSLRASNFNKDNPWGPDAHNSGQSFSVARNFVHLTPELGQYLRDNAFSKVNTAFTEYKNTAPYWFVTRFEATYNEQVTHHLYDYAGMFAAKALIFGASRDELARYLDVPAFARGDLFYIQNLVYTLRAPSTQ